MNIGLQRTPHRQSRPSIQRLLFQKKCMMIGWAEPEALMSVLQTEFHDSRRLMGATCTKVDSLDPKGAHSRTMFADGLIRSMERGTIPRRDNISQDFQKEHFHQLYTAHRHESSAQRSSGGGLKCQSDAQFYGGAKRLKGKIQQPIAQALQPVFRKCGHKLNLSTVLQHASTNANESLGPQKRCDQDFAPHVVLNATIGTPARLQFVESFKNHSRNTMMRR